MYRVSIDEKICFLLGIPAKKAKKVLKERRLSDLDAVKEYIPLENKLIDKIIANPQFAEECRIEPNKVNELQVKQIPHVDKNNIMTILNGRPYYTMEEMAIATKVSRTILEDLFIIPPLQFTDKKAGKTVTLSPIFGNYIIPFGNDFEENDYGELISFSKGFKYQAIKFDADKSYSPPHKLKEKLKGNICPVVRDNDGFKKFFVPGSFDLWFKQNVSEYMQKSIINEF